MEELDYTSQYRPKYKFSLLKQRNKRQFELEVSIIDFSKTRLLVFLQKDGKIYIEKPEGVQFIDYIWQKIIAYCVKEIRCDTFVPFSSDENN